MSLFEVIFTTLISSGIVSALIFHFGKQWITKKLDYQYAAKLEIHKSDMKALSDIELEKLKSSLSIEANKHNIVFNNLHEKRAEILAKTYQLLVTTYNNLEAYTSPIEFTGSESKEVRRKEFGVSLEVFTKYYSSHAIYLPEQIIIKLEELDKKMTISAREFMLNIELPKQLDVNKWEKISNEVRELTNSIMRNLEDEFRQILSGGSI